MNIYSIGFSGKSAEEFFKLLNENNVKKIIDIRQNRKSQLSGFAKHPDIEYFAKLHGIDYVYYEYLAPTKELRDEYTDKKSNKKSDKKMTFQEYTIEFNRIIKERNAIIHLSKDEKDLDGSCFLCSEDEADECHRSLVINAILMFLETLNFNEIINVIHLISSKALNNKKKTKKD